MVYTAEAGFLDDHTVQLVAESETIQLTALPYIVLRDHIFTHTAMSESVNDLLTKFEQ